ncbi:hypothetical protein [Staphylococcus condimenti]|uniref:hypothetical protein n=1 Tax=Staphylococcus condimenti TaxID=70255 RepID=UPI001A92B059|nr:hypothetical protein [Staphylococcus condimenti]
MTETLPECNQRHFLLILKNMLSFIIIFFNLPDKQSFFDKEFQSVLKRFSSKYVIIMALKTIRGVQ